VLPVTLAEAQIVAADRRTVAHRPGAHYGFPRLVRARNGDLLLVYRSGETTMTDRSMIAVQTSRDAGRTWSEQVLLRDTPLPDHGWHNPVALAAPSGRVLLWFSNLMILPPYRRHPGYWCWSGDNGRTWTPASPFDDSMSRSSWYVSDAINTSDGMLASAATFPPGGIGNCYTAVWYSSDGGQNWRVRSLLTRPEEDRGDETALLETSPDTILALLRMRHGKGLAQFRSSNGGRVWTEGPNLYPMLGCTLERPFLTRLGPHRVLLTGRDVEHRRVAAWLSEDNARSFGNRLAVDGYTNDGGYTSCVATGPDSALMAYYTDVEAAMGRAVVKTVRLTVK
jgi:Neuraminidase (sialidase)